MPAKPQDNAWGAGPLDALEVPCVGCGYDLRSLPTSGSCPECGEPVAHSTHRSGFDACDLRWLRQAALGARLLYDGLVAAILLAMLGGLVVALYLSNDRGLSLHVTDGFVLLVLALPGLSLAVAGVGAWLLGAPGRPRHETRITRTAAWTLRLAPVALAAGIALEVTWDVNGLTVGLLLVPILLHALSWRLVALGRLARLYDGEPSADNFCVWSFLLMLMATALLVLTAVSPGDLAVVACCLGGPFTLLLGLGTAISGVLAIRTAHHNLERALQRR